MQATTHALSEVTAPLFNARKVPTPTMTLVLEHLLVTGILLPEDPLPVKTATLNSMAKLGWIGEGLSPNGRHVWVITSLGRAVCRWHLGAGR